jgi:hypothetical protein
VIVEEFVRQVAAITVLESREPFGDLRIVPAVRGLGRQQRVEEGDGGVDAPHDAEACLRAAGVFHQQVPDRRPEPTSPAARCSPGRRCRRA